jgi:glucosamine-6-phosphate deaminase
VEVIIQPDEAAASALAARIVQRLLTRKPAAVIGLPAGGTPRRLYQELSRLHRDGGLSFRAATTFNLDEYIGIPANHPGSFRAALQAQLFDHVDVTPERTHIPDGMAADPAAECEAYERLIAAAGGIDLQILGIGADGHLGFNEPSSSLGSRTRVKTLMASTRVQSAGDFGGAGHVPRHAITMGLGTILEARQCLLLAFGDAKAEAIRRAIEGPVTAMCPASVLQLHADVRVVLDPAAARLLELREYYLEVYANKPEWQRD